MVSATAGPSSSNRAPDYLIPARGTPTEEQREELAACAASFWDFLPYWSFKNRESGAVQTFGRVWKGQARLARAMDRDRWLCILKAGKLGFSELACAYDGWVMRFGPRNARVHLFSYSGDSAREIFSWVRFGLEHLPEWMRLPMVEDEAGANHSSSIKLYAGPDDVRRIVAYASSRNISIDQTCTHAHLDEFARWPFLASMWAAIQSTIAPTGSCHIVTRGAGPNLFAKIYKDAKAGKIRSQSGQVMRAFFAAYHERADRGRTDEERAAWLEGQRDSYPSDMALWQWAPTNEKEALQGDDSYVYPTFAEIIAPDPCELWECPRIVVGIDPGNVNPTAMGLWGERSSGRAHGYDEFYQANVGIDEIEGQLVRWLELARRRAWDSASGFHVVGPPDEKWLVPTLQAHGFNAFPAITDINGGIALVQTRIRQAAMTVSERMVHHIEEAEDYRSAKTEDRVTRIEYAGERPMKHHADGMDEMRYAVAHLSAWPQVEQHEETGRSGRRYRS